MQKSKATLEIEGKSKDVSELIELALSLGCLTEVKITESTSGNGQAIRPTLKIGDRVVSKVKSTHYGVEKGWVGRIQGKVGQRWSILWDDNTESEVANSILRKI